MSRSRHQVLTGNSGKALWIIASSVRVVITDGGHSTHLMARALLHSHTREKDETVAEGVACTDIDCVGVVEMEVGEACPVMAAAPYDNVCPDGTTMGTIRARALKARLRHVRENRKRNRCILARLSHWPSRSPLLCLVFTALDAYSHLPTSNVRLPLFFVSLCPSATS